MSAAFPRPAPKVVHGLRPFDLMVDDLARSGLTPEDVPNYQPVECVSRLPGIRLNGAGLGYEIRFPADDGVGYLPGLSRVRITDPNPPSDPGNPSKPVRYWQASKSGSPLYIPARMVDQVRDALLSGDTTLPVQVVEGEKKADKVAKHAPAGWLVVGILGIDGGKTDGRLSPRLADLVRGRRVGLLPDGDYRSNPNVAAGLSRLVAAIRSEGPVSVAPLPWPAERKGIDDHLVAIEKAGGDPTGELVRMLAAASDPLELALQEVNETHFVIATGSSVRVGQIALSPETGKPMLVRQGKEDFKLWLAAKRFAVGRREIPLSTLWLTWPGRRQYQGVVLEPKHGRAPAGYLNLWRGWPVSPTEGDWSTLRDHIEQVICDGDAALFRYVLGWLARSVQRAGDPGEVALVLRGVEGCGKGILLRTWAGLFGAHGLQVARSKALVGDFNSHLAWVMALFADEAFFAGDRAHEGVLKALITEPTIHMEAKFVDASEVKNRLKIGMATNNLWAVPAGLEARRFCVIDVSGRRVDDRAYFRKLHAACSDDNVRAAMLYELLNMDLTNFEVRDIPKTQALADQKNLSLRGVNAFLRDALLAGSIEDREGGRCALRQWVGTDVLFDAYRTWAKQQRFDQEAVPRNIFGKTLARFFDPAREPSDVFKARTAGAQRLGPASGEATSRLNGYRLGTLAEARRRFTEVTALPMEWE